MKNKYLVFALYLLILTFAPIIVGIDYLFDRKRFPQGYMRLLGRTYVTTGLCIQENARR